MKKIIITLVLFLVSQCSFSQQYGWVKILDADSCGIISFRHFKYVNQTNNDIYILYGRPSSSNSISQPRYNSWSRYSRNTNTWYIQSHNSFLHSFPFFCYWPNVNSYVYSMIYDFKISRIDTSFIIEIRMPAVCSFAPPLEPAQKTYITYNNGLDSVELTQFGNDFIGNACAGFDIDPVNDAIIYLGYPNTSNWSVRCVWKSTDRGSTWVAADTISTLSGGGGLLRINPLRRNEIFVTAGYMYKSTGAGRDFYNTGVKDFDEMAFDMTDSSIYGATHLLPVQGLFKSTNHGDNWSLLKAGIYNSIEINPDNHNIVYLGSDSGLYRSVNGGLNFELYNNSFSPSVRVIGLSKDNGSGDTVIVSTNRAVYKVWGPYTGFINKSSSSIPTSFKLYQNYPNPFNPMTTLKIDVPPIHLNPPARSGGKGVSVRLVVYDLLGREVVTLINTDLLPGTYTVDWDASNYASGLYYYRLITDEFVQTKKMVLIK